jgi:hypothetical protein
LGFAQWGEGAALVVIVPRGGVEPVTVVIRPEQTGEVRNDGTPHSWSEVAHLGVSRRKEELPRAFRQAC